MGRLLDWFGASRKEIWRKLSADLDARYTEGTWRRSDRIAIGAAYEDGSGHEL